MLFITTWFLLFFAFSGFVYFLFGQTKFIRLTIILITSVLFYIYFGGLFATFTITCLGLYTYVAGFVISRFLANKKISKILILLSLSPVIFALGYFKYANFFKQNFFSALDFLGLEKVAALQLVASDSTNVIAILGISFFTFEFTHYLVEIYRGAEPLRNPVYFCVFVFYFPRLASGPIVRVNQIVPQLKTLERPRVSDFSYGLFRVFLGFTKKFVLADQAAAILASTFQASNVLVGTDVLMLIVLLYIRIYFDFSAYSDIAIGISRMYGIRLPENFAWPFLATSLIDFWKRWHISLSTWIRDYVYIPLGGSKYSRKRKFANLLIAMTLCGLWHGPAWNFCLWGLLHGLALVLNHLYSDTKNSMNFRNRELIFVRNGFSWIATQIFVGLAWIPFFYPLKETLIIFSKLGVWL